MVKIIVAPSILAYDNCNLLQGIRLIESLEVKWLHVDIMDGHFVNNISFGPKLITDLRKHTQLFLDVHLMLRHPENFIEKFIKSGANAITIHQEATCNFTKILSSIKKHNCLCGLAINPKTQPNFELLKFVDFVLVMGVYPGFCGQKFISHTLNTIEQLSHFREKNKLQYKISVDGGITSSLVPKLITYGIDIIVSGSNFFKAPEDFIRMLNIS